MRQLQQKPERLDGMLFLPIGSCPAGREAGRKAGSRGSAWQRVGCLFRIPYGRIRYRALLETALVAGIFLAFPVLCAAQSQPEGTLSAGSGGGSPEDAAQSAMQAGAAAMRNGEFAQAVRAFHRVTELMPASAEGYFNLGLAEEQAGELSAARAALKQALARKPQLRGVNLFLGFADYRENHFARAEQRFLRETELDPRDAKAFLWLGVARLARDNPSGAVKPLDQAYALDPKDEDILYHRGRAYLLVANASYDAMYKLDPDSMRVHQVLAEAYAQSYRNQEAASEFELAIQMAPHQPGLHEELGDQLWASSQFAKVEAAYRAELAVDPYSATTKYKLGSFLVLNQKPQDGIPLLQEALAEDPGLSDAHYYLGSGLAATDHAQAAIQEFQKAIAADPGNDRAMMSWYKLAQEYRKQKDTSDATEAMKNFLRMREQTRNRQKAHAALIARDRSGLPVSDPDESALTQSPGVNDPAN